MMDPTVRLWIPSIVIALTACSAPPSDTDAGVHEACVPRTCASAGAECGALDDGCGGSLECGTCEATETCGIERANVCGGECRIDSHCTRGAFCDPARGVCTTGCRGPTRAIGVDIAPVRVELVVTLDGAPMPDVSGEGTPSSLLLYGEDLTTPAGVALYDYSPETGVHTARERTEIWLLPGRYRVALDMRPSGVFLEHWPAVPASLGTIEVRKEGSLHVDVPRVRATLEVRLAGSVPPAGDGPILWLLSDRLAGGRFELSASPTAWWVPGEYEVLYAHVLGANEWPQNRNRSLGSITIGEDTTTILDVPRARIAFDVMLDGAPRPSSGVYGQPELELVEVVEDAEPLRIPLYEERGDVEALPDPVGAWVLPGTYALYYQPGGRLLEWPASRALLDDALVIEGDRVVPIDVRRVRVDASVTLGGAAPPSRGCGSVSIGTWDIMPSADGEPRSAWMIPGRYDVDYSTDPCWERFDASWPATGAILGEQLVLGDGPVVVDVPRARLTVTATLAGAPLPDVTLALDSFAARPLIAIIRSGAEHGHALGLRNTHRGPIGAVELGLYARVGDHAEPTDTHELALIPGSYDVYYVYGTGEFEAEWPSGPAMLLSAVEVRSDGALAIDVPRTSVDLAVTLSGGGLGEPIRERDAWWQSGFRSEISIPEVALVRADAFDGQERASFDLYERSGEQYVPIGRQTRWVLPGTYAVRYQVLYNASEDVPVGWPIASGDLGCWIVP